MSWAIMGRQNNRTFHC